MAQHLTHLTHSIVDSPSRLSINAGIELVVFNVCTSYFVATYEMELATAALVSAAFGFFNIFSRPGGGWLRY